ncbi:tetratricopeptide repeat protein [Streptomyces sp. DSM 41982]|uniref:Tetratricopeptide repeat protein n=1 Tax=Streptomyces evansiae TaxID=3075535 RepID=A0ABD5E1T7_9ACTN|nr:MULTISPECIES: tetratricopeptide repeat protein [unclassified Streptomyces]MDT0414602.1 tetratricopeptide repeat protein [Streptomyces sp. DSM 41982]SCD32957.1 Tetratricopeptide repeat-containing protein [Streptomyces sp. SolWspMP-sol7th]
MAANYVNGGMHAYFYANGITGEPGPVMTLPAAPSVFVGREHEVARVRDVLAPVSKGDRARAVVVSVLTGLGGIGKTALALHTAHLAYEEGWYTDVVFVDLRGYDRDPLSADQALEVVLRALDPKAVDVPPTQLQRAGLLSSKMAAFAREGRSVLLVADNASSSAQIRPLVPVGGRHRLLVTSRHSHPDLGARLVDIASLSNGAGIALLRARLLETRPADGRVDNAHPDACALVTWCAGHPLALRICAAVLVLNPSLTVGDLLRDLKEQRSRVDALDAYVHSTDSERALRATFDMSHHQLRPRPRQLLHLLALTPGADIGLPAAAALAQREPAEVRRELEELTRAHLLTHDLVAGGSRWAMHDLTRDHAAHQTDAGNPDGRPDDEAARAWLLAHYSVLADAADQHLRALPGTPVPDTFPGHAEALAWMDVECVNLLAVIRERRNPATARLALCLATHLDYRRRFEDAVAVFSQAVEVLRATGDRAREGAAQNCLGNALYNLRRHDEAVAAHEESLTICRETRDRRGESRALNGLGLALQEVGRCDEAITVLEDSLVVCRGIEDAQGESTALNRLGLALQEVKRYSDAITAHEESLAICREIEDRRGESKALNNLGLALGETEDFEGALAAHRADLKICREIGDRHSESLAYVNLGRTLYESGHYEEAVTAFKEAWPILRNADDHHSEGVAHLLLGIALREAGRNDEAATAFEKASTVLHKTDDHHSEGLALFQLGFTHYEAGHYKMATSPLDKAVPLLRETDEPHFAGVTLNVLGVALLMAGDFEEAITAHQEALAVHRETDDRENAALTLGALGLALHEAKSYEKAVLAYEQAVTIYRQIGDRKSESETLDNLGLTLRKLRRYERAVTAHEQALAICRETGDLDGESASVEHLTTARAVSANEARLPSAE